MGDPYRTAPEEEPEPRNGVSLWPYDPDGVCPICGQAGAPMKYMTTVLYLGTWCSLEYMDRDCPRCHASWKERLPPPPGKLGPPRRVGLV